MRPYNKNEHVPKQPTHEVINENGHCVFKDFLHIVIDLDQDDLSMEKAMNHPLCSDRPKKDS